MVSWLTVLLACRARAPDGKYGAVTVLVEPFQLSAVRNGCHSDVNARKRGVVGCQEIV